MANNGSKKRKDYIPCQSLRIEMVREGPTEEIQVFNAHDAVRIMQDRVSRLDRECFWVIPLTGQNVVGIHLVSMGSLTASIVHPREVFKIAILANATAIICIHNHPSGNPEPSSNDRALIARLNEAGKLLCIDVADFIIIGNQKYWSSASSSINTISSSSSFKKKGHTQHTLHTQTEEKQGVKGCM